MILVFAPLSAIGYAVVDLMPWSMIGDVIDEDDLATGERREGLYHGMFLFLRKLAGAVSVFVALGVLDLAGLRPDGPQTSQTLWAIRLMASLGPASCLLVAIWLSYGYRLTRAEHARIRTALSARSRLDARAGA